MHNHESAAATAGNRSVVSAIPIALILVIAAVAHLGAQQHILGGSLSCDYRLGVGEDLDIPDSSFSRALVKLDLHAELDPNDKVHIFVDGWLTAAWDFPAAFSDAESGSDNPFDYQELLPLETVLREAYVDLYGFPHSSMDLRAGRQRIVWGTAEQVSVIDNLNPSDLEDFWDFGRRLPSEALKVSWYARLFTLEGVCLPLFRPAVLPGQMFDRMQSAVPDLSPLVLSELSMGYTLPGSDPWSNASAGARLSVSLLGWDLALSYIYGRQDFPAPTTITVVDAGAPSVDVEIDNRYPRRHIAGLDLVGELFGLGLWAEGALFFPDHTLVTDTSGVGGGVSREDAECYFKACAGLDYTFAFGPYLNLQYVHGLAFENSRDELQDYLLAAVEWEVLNGRLKLGPLAVALEVDDIEEIADSWAVVLNPELSLKPFDSAEISAGLRWIQGKEGTTFGLSKEESELYIEGTFSF
ncbi:MAG: hypothetical protein JXB06_03275 [Spirochaetales bacterium]|nr:hypothetical protein [Spirochaetales bacterium]